MSEFQRRTFLLAQDLQTAAGQWLFSQPTAVVVAILSAAAALYGLYWFANLHARTVTAAASDMKAAMTATAEAFTKDQERDRELFIREQERNRDLVRSVMENFTKASG